MIEYHEHAPPPHLASFVRCIWTLRGASLPPDTVLPDGSMELVFHGGDDFAEMRDGVWHRQPRALVAGTIAGAVTIRGEGEADVIGVRFIPAMAYRVVAAARELAGTIADLHDVVKESDVHSVGDAIRFVEHNMRDADPLFDAAVRLVIRSRGRARIEQIAAHAGTTQRTLARRFDEHAGISPKAFSRVIRFDAALRSLRRSATPDDDGYCDDAHRIREFQEIAGATPREILANPHRLSEIFNA